MQSASLTPREKECLQGIFAGKSNREIGNDIGISEETVKNHLKMAYEKLGIHTTRHLFPLVIAANRKLRDVTGTTGLMHPISPMPGSLI